MHSKHNNAAAVVISSSTTACKFVKWKFVHTPHTTTWSAMPERFIPYGYYTASVLKINEWDGGNRGSTMRSNLANYLVMAAQLYWDALIFEYQVKQRLNWNSKNKITPSTCQNSESFMGIHSKNESITHYWPPLSKQSAKQKWTTICS